MKLNGTLTLFVSALFLLAAAGGPSWAQSATSVTLTLSASSAAPGTPVTLTAKVVAAGQPVTPGLVLFCNASVPTCQGPALLGQGQLTASGTATTKLIFGAGTHSLKAMFAGTNAHAASTSAASSFTVGGAAPSATTINVSGSAGSYTLAATVSGNGTQIPTGTVSFMDTTDGALLGSASLGAGSTTGGFTPVVSANAGYDPQVQAIGDFNGDGKPDVAVANFYSNTVTVLLGNGDGTFTFLDTFGTAPNPNALAVGDFNNDGKLDIVTANSAYGSLTVLLGNGDGTFQGTEANLPTGYVPTSIAVGDFNHDGNADLAVTNQLSSTVTIFVGDGTGNFTVSQSPATDTYPYSAAVGDFNGDGKQDLAVANYYGNDVTVLLGNGDGTFSAAASSPGTGVYPDWVVVGDFNGDGKQDLAVTNQFSGTVTILLGDGKGDFAAPTVAGYAPPSVGANPGSVALADFNGDGKEDLAVTSYGSNTVTFLFGKGDGSFQNPQSIADAGTPHSIGAADLNGDGRTDVLTSNSGNAQVTSILNSLTSTAATKPLAGIAVPGFNTQNVVASYSGNTAYLASESSVAALAGSGVTTTTALSVQPSSNIATGETIQLTATVAPAQVDGVYAGATVAFVDNGSIIGTAQVSNSGLAVFNYTIASAGSHALFATYSGNGIAFAGSQSGTTTITAVARSSSTTVLAFSPAAPVKGSVVTLTASVTSGGKPVLQGTVTFCHEFSANMCVVSYGTAPLTGGGKASIKTVLPTGTDGIQAAFNGTALFASSFSSVAAVTVSGSLPSTTTLALSGSPGNYTATATVAGTFPPPMGTVSLVDTSNQNLPVAMLYPTAFQSRFSQSTVLTTGSFPGPVVTADFNNDGRADLVAGDTSNYLTVQLGNGNGTFTAKPSIATGQVVALAAGDFNGDGMQDLAVSTAGSNVVTILLGNGDGAFTAANGLPAGAVASSIVVGDFNGDGVPDLATIAPAVNAVTIFVGNGNGTFTNETQMPETGSSPRVAVSGDFNGDGKLDLAVTNGGSNNVTILLGNGDGTFTATSVSPAVGTDPFSITAADFNLDGNLDLAVANQVDGTVSILLNQGQAVFQQAGPPLQVQTNAFLLLSGDFNGDGAPDLIVTSGINKSLSLLTGNFDGTFATQTVSLGSNAGGIAAADFNSDGGLDVAYTEHSTGGLAVLLNSVVTIETMTGISVPGAGTHQIQAVYAVCPPYAASSSNLVVAVASPIVSTVVVTPTPDWIVTAGQTEQFKVTVSPLATDNYQMSGTVSLYNGSILVGTATLVNGSATFSSTLATAGIFNFTAKYSGNIDFTAAVSAPTAVHVVAGSTTTLTSFTSTATAGSQVILTALVTSGGKIVSTGLVTLCDATAAFCDNSAALGTASLTAAGPATFRLVPGIGTHSYKAVFSGTLAAGPSSSAPLSFTVTGVHATSTTLSDAVVSGKYNLTAVVTEAGTQAPTGKVTFLDIGSNATLGTATLANPTAPLLSFHPLSTVSVSGGVVPVATGDFNHDGQLDLAVGGSGLTILLGNGKGALTTQFNTAAAGGVTAIAVGDFNADSLPDLAVVNFGANTLTILLGKGDGTFTVKSTSGTGSAPNAVAITDLNGDGKLDVALTNDGSGSVSMFLGNGDGTFTAKPMVGVGALPNGVVAGDFNQDGKPDLAVTNYFGDSVSILLGNGDGTFTSVAAVSVGRFPQRIVVGDFNGDGKLDFAVTDAGAGTLSIALGNGDGTFGTALTASLGTGISPSWLAAGDFNLDGKLDLAVTAGNKAEVLILPGNGNGTFGLEIVASPTGNAPQFLAVGDFTGDGEADLALAVSSTNQACVLENAISTSASATLPGVILAGPGYQNVEASYPGAGTAGASASNVILLPPNWGVT
jgi:hypothetical protein